MHSRIVQHFEEKGDGGDSFHVHTLHLDECAKGKRELFTEVWEKLANCVFHLKGILFAAKPDHVRFRQSLESIVLISTPKSDSTHLAQSD